MSSVPYLERIFFECLQKGTQEERAAYLAQACAGDVELLRRLQKMLEAHDGDFLEQAAHVSEATGELPTIAERPGQRIDAYVLVERLGEGGMGTVWRAEQVQPVRRQVALKLIKAGMDSRQVVARFEAERQALALMDHPNIARVLDGGADALGRPYFVMDLFAGIPITRYCDDRRLPVRQRLELFAQVCDAIQHAHQKGVIHRDIKPSNVLVALQDGHAVPKVIDFGIAKAVEQKLTEQTVLTQMGGILGTLEYMSPEQSARSAEGVDTRSDIYSLGVLLYELLTGSTPLSRRLVEQGSLADILRVIADGETPKPSTRLREAGATTATLAAQRGVVRTRLASLVSGDLDWIVMKALEKDRDRRYATAADLAQDVRRFLAHEPVLACPPSAAYRLRKFARRRRGALVAASALAVALLVAIGGIGWAVRDRAARRTETERAASDRQARVVATVQELLAAVERQMAAQAFPEALATVRRADAAATSGEADAATTSKVRELLQDLEFVDRLERIRSRPTTWTGSGFDAAGAVREFTEAFRDHGVELESAPVEAMAERLRTTPALAIPLATGLDEMTRRSREAKLDRDTRQRIVLLANAIDPEPMRVSIRSVWLDPNAKVPEELLRVAETLDLRAQHPATLDNLEWTLRKAHPAIARRLQRDAQRAHPSDFWLAFQFGAALDGEGDRDGALVYTTAAVAIRPDSAPAHSNIAHVLLQRGEIDAAIASLKRAIECDPQMAMPHINMGAALQSKPHEAIKSLRTAIELDPKSALAWVGLGTMLLQANQLQEAGDAFARAAELQPGYAEAHAGVSNVLREQGRLQEALAPARRSIATDPRCVTGHIALGSALCMTDDPVAGAQCFRKAVELDPRNAVAHANLATVLSSSHDPAQRAEAIAMARKSVALDPAYPIGQHALANALLRDGQDDEGVAACRKTLELAPNFAAAYVYIGVTARKHGRTDEALKAYRNVVKLRPGDADAWSSIALMHYERDELAEAEAALRKFVGLEPGDASGHHLLAEVLGLLGKQEESIASYARAVELEPSVAPRQRVLAAAHCRAGNWQQALDLLQRAAELDPDGRGSDWFCAAIAHKQLGDAGAAQAAYDQGSEWMERARSEDEDARRLREEAAGLLGVEIPPR